MPLKLSNSEVEKSHVGITVGCRPAGPRWSTSEVLAVMTRSALRIAAASFETLNYCEIKQKILTYA